MNNFSINHLDFSKFLLKKLIYAKNFKNPIKTFKCNVWKQLNSDLGLVQLINIIC
jgi:hypothetical protein